MCFVPPVSILFSQEFWIAIGSIGTWVSGWLIYKVTKEQSRQLKKQTELQEAQNTLILIEQNRSSDAETFNSFKKKIQRYLLS